ncbi:hypothetical protein D6817_01300 [Candidatus Pacearchaeota archaeon]|nr:MAG: hypothetical protein D6817_01300 [Candidatus Pacearchaeota archaeon]
MLYDFLQSAFVGIESYRLVAYAIVLLSAAAFGDGAIVFFSVLAAQGHMSIAFVFIFSFFGTLLGDFAWFTLSRTKLIGRYLKKRQVKNFYVHFKKVASFISAGKHFIAVVMAKFLYGTRVLTVFYLRSENIKSARFMAYDSVATLLWLSVLVPAAWLAGKGVSMVLESVKNVQFAIAVSLGVVIVFYFAGKHLIKALAKVAERR